MGAKGNLISDAMQAIAASRQAHGDDDVIDDAVVAADHGD